MGTMPFSHGLPLSTFSAWTDAGTPLVGAMYDPFLDRMFSATVGQGAYLNDRRLFVADRRDLSHALLDLEGVFEKRGDCIFVFEPSFQVALEAAGARVATFWSVGLPTALIAAGQVTATLFNFGKPEDGAAVKVIVDEAGGRLTDLFGDEQTLRSSDQRISRQLWRRCPRAAAGPDRRPCASRSGEPALLTESTGASGACRGRTAQRSRSSSVGPRPRRARRRGRDRGRSGRRRRCARVPIGGSLAPDGTAFASSILCTRLGGTPANQIGRSRAQSGATVMRATLTSRGAFRRTSAVSERKSSFSSIASAAASIARARASAHRSGAFARYHSLWSATAFPMSGRQSAGVLSRLRVPSFDQHRRPLAISGQRRAAWGRAQRGREPPDTVISPRGVAQPG